LPKPQKSTLSKKNLASLPKPTGKLSDSTYINTLNDLAWGFSNINPDSAISLSQKALQLSEKINWKIGKAVCLRILGSCEVDKGNYSIALEYYKTGLKIVEEIDNKIWQAKFLSNIGLIYDEQSDYPKALEYYFKALKIKEKLDDKKGISAELGNIGVVFYEQSNYTKALEYYFNALKMKETIGDKKGIATMLSNIGIVYFKLSDYTKTLEYYFKALKIAEEVGHKQLEANTLSNIGIVYARQLYFTKSLEFNFKALKIAKELGYKLLEANILGNIGNVYKEMGKFKEAEKYLKQAIYLSNNIGALEISKENEYHISQIYESLGQYHFALTHFKKYIEMRDSINIDEKRKKIDYLASKYEWEKKEALINAEREKERTIFETNQRKNKIIIFTISTATIILSTFLFFVYRTLNITRKQKRIIEVQKNEVERQKLIVEIQKAEAVKQREIAEEQKAKVEEQKKIIEEKNKDIMDSINYALRIQQAILPDEKKWERLLPNSFKLYLPKDVLAGDFYWLEENENYIYVAAADCTGHGVPGAMVSVVCSSALTKAVLEDKLTNTNEILDRVREIVVEKISSNEDHLRDGMDICLVRINKTNRKEIQYSGANRSLYIIKANGVLEELSPDKQPIGWMEETRPFKAENKVLKQGDMLYLTTDGFADQFGGPKQKKLKTKGMLELFVNVHSLPINEQKEKIQMYYSEWKGNGDQTDDVCVIGIKV